MKIFIILLLLIVNLSIIAQPKQTGSADETAVRKSAKAFVADLARTHHLQPLLQKWFIKNWEDAAKPEVIDSTIWDESFKKLPPIQRGRMFLAYWNWMYLMIVINSSTPEILQCYNETPECKTKETNNLLRVFSKEDVTLIQKLENSDSKEKNELDIFVHVPLLEYLNKKALPVLHKKNFEQSKEFYDSIKLFEENSFLNYIVETAKFDKNIKDQNGRNIIKKGEVIYSVETPLLIRVDFVKRENHFKVFNLGVGDGD